MSASAVITGASRGIGLAVARELALDGYALTIVARDGQALHRAAEELRCFGVPVQVVAGSVSETGFAERVIGQHLTCYAGLDTVVNNAGVAVRSPFEELSEKQMTLQLSVNFWAVVRVYRAALPALLASASRRGSALVVNVASMEAEHPEVGLSLYAAAKAAVVAFSRAMNKEYGERGVRSCALCPGYVDTGMVADHAPAQTSGPLIQPQDVAEMVRALARLSPACEVSTIELHRSGERPL